MLEITVNISGSTTNDLDSALNEVQRLVAAGFTSGMNRNDSARFSFDITGEAEAEPDAEEEES